MAFPFGFISGVKPPKAKSPESITEETNSVVVLAALICLLICVFGVAAVTCWLGLRRRRSVISRPGHPTPRAPDDKCLEKKILKSLPKWTYTDAINRKLADCAICLSEFVAGDEVRVLVQCDHVFHVGCIDTWLAIHSSCPSCRQHPVLDKGQTSGDIADNTEAG